jgi:glycosyltransferase involved in cell wall biosynthesis
MTSSVIAASALWRHAYCCIALKQYRLRAENTDYLPAELLEDFSQGGVMAALVSIGVPVYKRLSFLPNVLNSVSHQDYSKLELIVSDNGMNGAQLSTIIKEHYPGQFKLRQNAQVETMSTHFNQIINAASGKYFMLLCDDDEISPNYVSELVALLEQNRHASIGLSRQEIMDEGGTVIRRSSDNIPPLLSGPDFIRAAWETHQYKYEGFATYLARTDQIKACGGYPEFCKGMSHDDALLLKLCIDNYVALSSRCAFRFRIYDSSHGATITIEDVKQATKQFLRFLDCDPQLQQFALKQPSEWKSLKKIIERMNWEFYYERWSGMYRDTLSRVEWVKAAFALPFIPGYYRRVAFTLTHVPSHALSSWAKALMMH